MTRTYCAAGRQSRVTGYALHRHGPRSYNRTWNKEKNMIHVCSLAALPATVKAIGASHSSP